jgi:hypothetical protein
MTGCGLEDDRIGHRASVTRAFATENEGGPDIRMTGEGQFRARRENSDLRGMRGILRRQNECDLRQIELGGDGLHLIGAEAAAVGHDRQRIAAEFSIGEDVNGDEFNLHRRLDLWRASLSPARSFAARDR